MMTHLARYAGGALLALWLPACMVETEPLEDEESLDVDAQSAAVRGGVDVTKRGVVNLFGCTGSMIGPTLILTAAHCFDEGTLKKTGAIYYFKPGTNPQSPPLLYDGPLKVWQHPQYSTSTPIVDRANHDFAIVQLTALPRWPGTDHGDYLDLYTDNGSDVPDELTLYGAGYNWLTAAHGDGTLRMASFDVDYVNKYRIRYEHTKDEGVCRGDSGGPYLFPGTDLIVCTESSGNHDGDFCGQDDGWGDDSGGQCTRTYPVGEHVRNATGLRCYEGNNGYKYNRCYGIPLNDLDPTYAGPAAVALQIAAVL